jgi:hypothetical protein
MAQPEAVFEEIVRAHFSEFEAEFRDVLGWKSEVILQPLPKPVFTSRITPSGKSEPDGLLEEAGSSEIAIVEFKVGVRASWVDTGGVKDQILDYKYGAKKMFGGDVPLLLVSHFPLEDVRAIGVLPLKLNFQNVIVAAMACTDTNHNRVHKHFEFDEFGDYRCIETREIWSKDYDLPLPSSTRENPWPRKGPRNAIFRFIHEHRNIVLKDLIEWAKGQGYNTGSERSPFGVVVYNSAGRIKYETPPYREMSPGAQIDIVWPRHD